MNEIKDPCIKISFHIWLFLKTLSLIGILSNSVIKLTIYHLYYKEILEIKKCAPFFQSLFQLSSLPVDLPDYVGKFASYHLYYKENPKITKFSYDPFFLRPSPKLLLLGIFSDYICKFSIYYPHYKKNLNISNLT